MDSAVAKEISGTADIDWPEKSGAIEALHLTAIPLKLRRGRRYEAFSRKSVNRHSRTEKKESKWAKSIQINTSNEYRKRLEDAGYIDIILDDHSRKGWIVVVAKKPQGGVWQDKIEE